MLIGVKLDVMSCKIFLRYLRLVPNKLSYNIVLSYKVLPHIQYCCKLTF